MSKYVKLKVTNIDKNRLRDVEKMKELLNDVDIDLSNEQIYTMWKYYSSSISCNWCSITDNANDIIEIISQLFIVGEENE